MQGQRVNADWFAKWCLQVPSESLLASSMHLYPSQVYTGATGEMGSWEPASWVHTYNTYTLPMWLTIWGFNKKTHNMRL